MQDWSQESPSFITHWKAKELRHQRVGLQEWKKETDPQTDFLTRSPPDVSHSPPTHIRATPTSGLSFTFSPPDTRHARSLTPRSPSRPTLAHLQTPHAPSSLLQTLTHTLFSCRLLTPARLSSEPLSTISPLQPTLSLPGHPTSHAPNRPRTASPEKPPAAPAPSDSARDAGSAVRGTHRLCVQAGRSPGSAASPRPPQSSESPAQVQAAEQGARPAALAGSGRSSSSHSSQGSRRGERRGAPSAPRTGCAILSGARTPARGCEVGTAAAQAARGLRSALGSAPGHGHRRKFSQRRLRAQRAPGARAARQRPEGAASPAPIRADAPALAANPTGPGQGRSADAPVLSPRGRPAGSRLPRTPGAAAAARTALSRAARALRPWASSSRLRRPQQPGPDAQQPLLSSGGRCAPLSRARGRALSPGPRTAPPRCAALREPGRPRAEQSAASRSPPADPAPRAPRPRPRRSPPHTRARRPAAPGRPTLDACPRRPATPRLLLIGCPSPRRPAWATVGAPAEIPPLPPLGPPAPLSFPTLGVKGGGTGRGKGEPPSGS